MQTIFAEIHTTLFTLCLNSSQPTERTADGSADNPIGMALMDELPFIIIFAIIGMFDAIALFPTCALQTDPEAALAALADCDVEGTAHAIVSIEGNLLVPALVAGVLPSLVLGASPYVTVAHHVKGNVLYADAVFALGTAYCFIGLVVTDSAFVPLSTTSPDVLAHSREGISSCCG